jgi:methionyl-tRNA formyltransferase
VKVVFMGTPRFALPAFEAIADVEEVIAVVTQPDRPSGRGLSVMPSAIKEAALARSLPVYQPERIRKDAAFIQALSEMAPEVIVVVAFGQILPASVLNIPPLGCVNLHASLLPKYRGAAPIQWALIQGESETGVTTMQMDAGMDTGPLLLRRTTPIEPDETSETLATRLSKIGAPLLLETLDLLKTGRLSPVAQTDTEVTMAPLLKKEEGQIRWGERAQAIFNRWRGVIPWPGSTTCHEGIPMRVTEMTIGSAEDAWGSAGETLRLTPSGLEVAAGIGYIVVKTLQPEGGRKMTPWQYAAGHPMPVGSIFRSA